MKNSKRLNLIISLLIIFNLQFAICNIYAQWFTQSLPTTNYLTTISCIDQNTGIAAGNQGTILRTTNAGLNWVIQNSGTFERFNNSFYPLVGGDLAVYLIGNNGIIRKSINRGVSWFSLQSPTSQLLLSIYFTNDVNGFIAGSDNTIFRTTNGGNNWLQLTTSLPSNTWLSTMVFRGFNTGWISGSSVNPVQYHLIKTTDAGNNWVIQNTPTSTFNINIGYNSQYSGDELWLAGSNVLYRSTDLGINWIQVSTPPGVSSSGDVIRAVFCRDARRVLVTTAGNNIPGIFVTTDYGISWVRQLSGNVGDIDFDFSPNGWAINEANFSNTVYRTTNGGGFTGFEPINNELPKAFSLSQNYPNPFNPNTKIKFDISSNVKSETSNVKLVVFDILGQEVTTLVNEQLQSGTYEVEWDAANFPSGVYYYKLSASDYTETKKMVFLK